MPPQMKRLFPQANISTTDDPKHGDDGNCAWVASTDPLFGRVADAWMKIMIADFGTDHWYQCDGFFTGMAPPWYDAADPATAVTGPAAYHAATAASRNATAAAAIGPALSAPIEPAKEWELVWKGAWDGMARTDPKAKWLYQGWAIRGWNDAAGASRIKALYDTVPKGHWIPLDMDIDGIWRYFGNYSFFDAPFIWTTLHDFGGNDGLKGDMRMLQAMPSDALAAGATIIGTGTTMEGINQNPPYYEYTYDTAWHREAQSLGQWFARYPTTRYGTANPHATAAWKILQADVYVYAGCGSFDGYHDGTGVEWKVFGAPPTCLTPTATNVGRAWNLLVQTGAAIDPVAMAPLNYDIVNTGRETLAHLITTWEHNLTAAVAAGHKKRALDWGALLLGAYADLDELLGCDSSFLIGPWIAQATKWADERDAPAAYYEWMAKSQVSTWWPVAPSDVGKWTANYTKPPPLDGYANKHWNGLVRDFYAPRVRCYVDQAAVDLSVDESSDESSAPVFNQSNVTRCAIKAEMAFTQSHTATVYSSDPTPSKTLALSKALLHKYAKYLQ